MIHQKQPPAAAVRIHHPGPHEATSSLTPLRFVCGVLQGELSTASPDRQQNPSEQTTATSGDKAAVEIAWGDHRIEATVDDETLAMLVDLLAPGTDIWMAWPELQAMLVEQILSEVSLDNAAHPLRSLRVIEVWAKGRMSSRPLFCELTVKLDTIPFTLGIHADTGAAAALQHACAGRLQFEALHEPKSAKHAIIAGTAIVSAEDITQIAEGYGVILDDDLQRQGKVLIQRDGKLVAICRLQGGKMVVEGQVGPIDLQLQDSVWNDATLPHGAQRLRFEVGRITADPQFFEMSLANGNVVLPPSQPGSVDVWIGERLVGYGELMRFGTEFGVRINRLVQPLDNI
ncbi:MAG: hypothetical protein ACRCWF_05980 [Beijerinckiaceae bacterium]